MAYHLLFLLLALSSLYTSSNGVSMSIDCGYGSDSYSDENSITWFGDEDSSNASKTVVIPTNSVPKPMRTLRVFTGTYKKNCYSVDAEKGDKVLVRASFYYGNYDKKSLPPSFDLIFEANLWTEVKTSMDQVVSHEIVYVTKTESVSVCLAQKYPDQLPFMSALEVHSLDMGMYKYVGPGGALMLRTRLACGAKEPVRYPSDFYDRIWAPAINSGGLEVLANDATFVDVTSLDDSPPEALFQNALSAPNTSFSITLPTNLPSQGIVHIYINLYVSEVTELDPTQKRSFKVFIDGNDNSTPVEPPYGKADQWLLVNITATANTTFSLVATANSTLPPLINGLEVFTINDTLSEGTFSDDVAGLNDLGNQFDELKNYGDPCLPAPYTWDWLNCSTDSTPRVTALYLNGYGLSGELPDFSSMTALETIDMHNNSLEGTIPEFLGTLPNLKLLNLADNKFIGPIPLSISENTKLKLIVSGNSGLCTSGKKCEETSTSYNEDSSGKSSGRKKKKKNKLPVIFGVTIPVFVLVWAFAGVSLLMRQKRKSAAAKDNSPGEQQNGVQSRVNGFLVNINGQTDSEAEPDHHHDQS